MEKPTDDDIHSAKHLLRYLRGTLDSALGIAPKTTPTEDLELATYVHSDWAGCRMARKSTSGGALQLYGCTVQFDSLTQGTIATSAG